MACIWLDLARYADTHGYQMDRYRAMWPFRDWVIKAFNQNQPYDQFVTWQLAGDLIPNASKEQRLATAFNRLHMQNEEGGIVEEEYRVAYNVDSVDTFGTAFLGLTFECSRCHDHKFDPITQKDFYSLFAFFQNVDESGQTSYFTDPTAVPTLILSDDATDHKLANLQKQEAGKNVEIDELRKHCGDQFMQWLAARNERPKLDGEIARFDFDQIKDGKIANAADPSKPGAIDENPKLDRRQIRQSEALLSGENGFHFPGIGAFTRTDAFSLSIWLKTPTHDPRMVVLHHSKAPTDAGSRGYELLLEDGRVAFGLHHMWPGNSIKVVTKDVIPIDQWSQVIVTYDGSEQGRAAHGPISMDNPKNSKWSVTTFIRTSPMAARSRTWQSDIASGTTDSKAARSMRTSGLSRSEPLSPIEVSELAGGDDFRAAWETPVDKLSTDQKSQLFDYFFDHEFEASKALRSELVALRKQENDLIDPIPEIMVMQELSKPKPAFILKRGAYDAPGDPVTANTPGILPPLAKDQPHNRLGLAHWLFDRQNPLTARVEVNRLWQQMFGQGIVASSDNFWIAGFSPAHPELLDWLAADFEKDWDIKRAAQADRHVSNLSAILSRPAEEELSADPDNHLFSRGPSKRLTAEMLRDQALFDSGLLVEHLGGPSVRPYQPPGVWDVAMGHPNYDQGHGDDLHRRSLYTFWKRSVPPPAMLAFDAPDRNYCVVRRQSTATPLQALALLNDVQITEAAKFISQQAMKEGGQSTDDRIRWMFRLICDRDPGHAETTILKQMYSEQHEIFQADSGAAKKLLVSGEAKIDSSLDATDLATGAVLAEAILNHDDAIMKVGK